METQKQIDTRWMKKSDVGEVSKFASSAEGGLTDRQLDKLISKPTVVCLVAEIEGRAVGFLAYDTARVSKLKVLNLTVDESFRRMGVGNQMVSLLVSKLSKKRSKIELSVSEYNLGAQLFLRQAGFKAVSVLDNAPAPSEYKFLYKFAEMAENQA